MPKDYSISDITTIIRDNVTHEVMEKIHKYVKIIEAWKHKINITSKSNKRHHFYYYISEAIALAKLLPQEEKSIRIVDVGSGAGFPGMILAMLGYYNCHLVEMNYKKAAFLQYVAAEIGITVKIHQCDIRSLQLQNIDYITSKACAKTSIIMEMCKKTTTPRTTMILCKSEMQSNNEISEIPYELDWSYVRTQIGEHEKTLQYGFLKINFPASVYEY